MLGFLADAAGVLWMVLALLPVWARTGTAYPLWWDKSLSYVMHNPFGHPAAFLWTLAAVALAGYCIYRFDKRGRPRHTGRQAERSRGPEKV